MSKLFGENREEIENVRCKGIWGNNIELFHILKFWLLQEAREQVFLIAEGKAGLRNRWFFFLRKMESKVLS